MVKRWWWIFIFLWSYVTAPWQQIHGKSIDNWLLNQSEPYIFVGDRKYGDLEIEENHIGSSNYKSQKSYSGLTLHIWIDMISFSYPLFCFLFTFLFLTSSNTGILHCIGSVIKLWVMIVHFHSSLKLLDIVW